MGAAGCTGAFAGNTASEVDQLRMAWCFGGRGAVRPSQNNDAMLNLREDASLYANHIKLANIFEMKVALPA